MPIKLSKLTPVDVREVWLHEAHGLTPWLLDNADELGEAIGLDLELTAAEHRVGDFRLDLIGSDGQGRIVIVENQLERSNHDHLGKLLTYAGGTDPAVIIWIAPKFNDAHRAAIDWINERTDEDTQFFAVEISAVRIGDSLPAPLFNVVAKPNNWTKQVHAETTVALSTRASAYSKFWSGFLERVRAAHPDWTNARAGSSLNWIAIPSGRSGEQFGFVFGQSGLRVEYYIDRGDADTNLESFRRLEARRAEIDASFGEPLVYESLPGKQACRIQFGRADGDILKEQRHDEYASWLLQTMERFRPAILAARATTT